MTEAVDIAGVCRSCEFDGELTSQGLVPAIRDIEAHLAAKPCKFVETGKCEAATYAAGLLMELSARESGT